MSNLFVFSGKIASGKDTLAKYLKNHLSDAVVRSFAFPLKAEVQQAIDFPEYANSLPLPEKTRKLLRNVQQEHSEGTHHGEHDSSSMRLLLQSWGTDFRRGEDPEYFVQKMCQRIKKDWGDGSCVIVSDCRFRNELQAMRDLGAITIRLSVDGEEQRNRSATRGSDFSSALASHISENDLDDEKFDIVIPSGLTTKESWEFLQRKLFESQ